MDEVGAPGLTSEDAPRLRKLTVRCYRNVRPGTQLRFNAESNLLVGKNGTGKTTFLKLIEALLLGRLDRLGQTPLDVEYELVAGEATVKVAIKWYCGVWNPPNGAAPPGGWLPTAGAPPNGALLPYDLSIDGELALPDREVVRWRYRAPAADFEIVEGGRVTSFNWGSSLAAYASPIPVSLLGNRMLPPCAHAMYTLNQLRYVDEALDYYAALLSWSVTIFRGPTGSHARPEGEVDNAATVRRQLALYGMPLEEIRKLERAQRTAADDPLLAEFERLLDQGEVRLEVPLKGYEVVRDEHVLHFDRPRLRITRPDGGFFFDEGLSFGQKRLFAFIHAVDTSRIVLADEPSNGLHRDWIDAMVNKLRGRQSFVAAQNPLWLDRVGFQSEEQMRDAFIFCRVANGELVWENASPPDVSDVFRAYDVGIQNVSEILWQKGLW